jgi:hypothetical protein
MLRTQLEVLDVLHSREWNALFRNPQAKRFVVPITAQLPDWDERIMADIGRGHAP